MLFHKGTYLTLLGLLLRSFVVSLLTKTTVTLDRGTLCFDYSVASPITFDDSRYPFTSIGVGGVVCNAAGEFLLIREKRGVYPGWKFPGGLADPGEDIFVTAKREVLEETGVETDFVTVLTMRYVMFIEYLPSS